MRERSAWISPLGKIDEVENDLRQQLIVECRSAVDARSYVLILSGAPLAGLGSNLGDETEAVLIDQVQAAALAQLAPQGVAGGRFTDLRVNPQQACLKRSRSSAVDHPRGLAAAKKFRQRRIEPRHGDARWLRIASGRGLGQAQSMDHLGHADRRAHG